MPFRGANAGLQLSSTPILGNNRTGSRTDNMNFNINPVPLPNLPADLHGEVNDPGACDLIPM